MIYASGGTKVVQSSYEKTESTESWRGWRSTCIIFEKGYLLSVDVKLYFAGPFLF